MYVGFRFSPDEDPVLLEILSILLGNYGSSLLYNALEKEKTLAYMVESKIRFLSDGGRFGIYVGVISAGQEKNAWTALSNLLLQIRRNGISEQELEWAKRVFRFHLLKQAFDPERAMWFLTKWGNWSRKFSDFGALEKRLAEVTSVQLQQLNCRLFSQENCFIAVVGPTPTAHLNVEQWRNALAD